MTFKPGIVTNPHGRPRIRPRKPPRFWRSTYQLIENNSRVRASSALVAPVDGRSAPAAAFLVADANGDWTLFECPRCHRRCRDLYRPELGVEGMACRKCLGLDYTSRHSGPLPIARIQRLRAKLDRMIKAGRSNRTAFYRIVAQLDEAQALLRRARQPRRVWKPGGSTADGQAGGGRWVKVRGGVEVGSKSSRSLDSE